MRKGRGWLIGLGVGLMLGSAMLQMMTVAQRSPAADSLPRDPLTRDELAKEAEAIGYRLLRSSEPTFTQEQLDSAVAAARKEAATGEEKPADGKEAEPSASPDAGEEPAKDAATGGTNGSPGALGLYVREHATLTEVANALKAMELIDDKAAFIKRAKPYGSKLRVGVSTFEGKPSVDDIIAELTRGKN